MTQTFRERKDELSTHINDVSLAYHNLCYAICTSEEKRTSQKEKRNGKFSDPEPSKYRRLALVNLKKNFENKQKQSLERFLIVEVFCKFFLNLHYRKFLVKTLIKINSFTDIFQRFWPKISEHSLDRTSLSENFLISLPKFISKIFNHCKIHKILKSFWSFLLINKLLANKLFHRSKNDL